MSENVAQGRGNVGNVVGVATGALISLLLLPPVCTAVIKGGHIIHAVDVPHDRGYRVIPGAHRVTMHSHTPASVTQPTQQQG
jgi:hypothetical protein